MKIIRDFIIYFFLNYLRFFARLAIFLHKPTVIGITGSVGKSSARNAVYAVLKDYFPTKMIEKGNSETGIPLGILGLEVADYNLLNWLKLLILSPLGLNFLKETKYLIIEMAVDEPNPPKNMEYLLTIVNPNISIFLNVFPVHTMQFESVSNITFEKAKIITKAKPKYGIFNNDDRHIKSELLKNSIKDTKLLKFGTERGNDISYSGYQVNLDKTSFEFNIQNESMNIDINRLIIPKEYREILAAAILTGKVANLTNQQIKRALQSNFSLPPSRASVFKGINNSMIIDSSYNASKASVIAFLSLANYLKHRYNRPLIFVFGDMRELGKVEEIEHKEVASKILETADYLYCVGPLTKKFVMPLALRKLKEVRWFENSILLGKFLKKNLLSNSLVLVKGSQNTIFLEETIKYILLNKNDEKRLCRQSDFWIGKKLCSPLPPQKFFVNIS